MAVGDTMSSILTASTRADSLAFTGNPLTRPGSSPASFVRGEGHSATLSRNETVRCLGVAQAESGKKMVENGLSYRREPGGPGSIAFGSYAHAIFLLFSK